MTYRKRLSEHDLCVQWCWIKHQREATGGGGWVCGSSGRGFSPSLQSKAFDSFPENRSLQWKRASGLPTGTEWRKTQCSKMGCWVTLMRWPLWREGDKETAKSRFPWFVFQLNVCMHVCLCVCARMHACMQFCFLTCSMWVWKKSVYMCVWGMWVLVSVCTHNDSLHLTVLCLFSLKWVECMWREKDSYLSPPTMWVSALKLRWADLAVSVFPPWSIFSA